ncbi:MAG: aldehyde dehydrogenase [Gammaproteobacteria bacterium]|nr:aldehyde dehydrogenase [Gammaproteobacteria bacterium]
MKFETGDTNVASLKLIELQDKLFIGGQWVPSHGDEWMVAINPATEAEVGRVPAAVEADMDAAVAAARNAFDKGPWPRMSLQERAEIIKKAAAHLQEIAGDMAYTITSEMGCTIAQSLSVQVPRAIDIWEYYANYASEYPWSEHRPTYDALNQDFEILVEKEPVGVVAAVVPWNGPQIVTALKLAPALMAGCTAVLKPSEDAPLSFCGLAEAFRKAGLPNGVLNIVPADRDVSEYLISHKGIDKASLTGSTLAGRKVGAICADTMTRCTLELGGKSAAILLDDVDLESCLAVLAPTMAFLNGQACSAPTRILLPKSRYEELSRGIVDAFSAMPFGDPMDMNTFVGPVAGQRHKARVMDYLKLGVEEGATVALGGGEPEGFSKGFFVEKTIFTNVNNSMRIAREEIFGPVFCLLPYDNESDALAIANDSEYGLAGSVWTSNPARGLQVARQIRAGSLGVNIHTLDMAAPFGGMKMSGVGRECGSEGLDAYVEIKSIIVPKGVVS